MPYLVPLNVTVRSRFTINVNRPSPKTKVAGKGVPSRRVSVLVLNCLPLKGTNSGRLQKNKIDHFFISLITTYADFNLEKRECWKSSVANQ